MSRLAPSPERARTRDDKKHLLIVEDEASIRDIVAAWLRDEGFTVTTAANGAEAIEQLRVVRPDAIVLDLMMPIMDGWAFAEACHRLIAPVRIPILVVSAAYGLPQAAERLRPYGVRACLAKPFDLDVLTATVRRLVERQPMSPLPAL
jgi:two-component system response regulator MprA